jgi:NAD(P)-dependent dehydrogenase (short-subunit alcohol dehydrogenase family)
MTSKIALVTGGSRGLGQEMAVALARTGVDVILTFRDNESAASGVVRSIRDMGRKAEALRFDIGDIPAHHGFLQQVTELLGRTWGVDRFDYLINNAGVGATIPIASATEEAFDNLLNIHYKGVYFLTQRSLPMMNDHGAVVFISTGTTRFVVPGYSIYASLKGAVEVLTRYVAREFGSRGIRANIVAPGPIETDFNNAAIRNNPQMKSALAAATALGRVGVADDVGGVVAFLCSEEARWINGQRIEVSGGINL